MKTIAAFLVLCFWAAAAPAGGFHIVKKFPVPGDGGWDYLTVDDANRRLYVSHGTEVNVLDADSGAVVGKIAETPGVHGIAIATDAGRGFVSNGGDSTITMFDLKTLKVLANFKSGGNGPDAIIYDPGTHRVFAMNHRGGSVTVIDPVKGAVIGNVEVGGALEFAAADKGNLYVNVEDKSVLAILDAKAMTLKKTVPVAPCEEPSALAMDKKNGRLFLGCGNHMMAVVDAASSRVIKTMPIGDHVDAAGFDPASGLIFFSCGDGTLSIFHQDSADNYSAVETVKTQPGAKTMALDPKSTRVFLSVAEYGAAPAGQKKGRRSTKPGTFQVLVVGR